jgi:heat shock protein HslJ
MGSYDVHAKDGIIKQEARTRMACADMRTEENIFNALKRVKTYKLLNDDQIALCGEKQKRPLIILQRTTSDVNTLSAFDGDWKIVAVANAIIPAGKKGKLPVSFNTTKESIYANAGCNEISAIFITDENDAYAISFPQVITTMKACPDMALEQQVTTALHETQSYNISGKGDVILYDKDGKLTMMLTKK